ncbi:MAG: DNA gyrase inhibitor YacG [Legionella sp.]|nr:MAG: DNA gyrase inhibitor YacG [Legionella sp.]
MNKLQKITCPICGKKGTWREDNPLRPFCSERCKLIDLGEWASDSRTIPGESVDIDSLDGKDDL